MQVARVLCGHKAMKMPNLQLWNESRGEAHAISYENWDYATRGSSKCFMIVGCIHTSTRGAPVSFQTIVLYKCSFANGCISTLRMSSFCATNTRNAFYAWGCVQRSQITSEHGIIIMLSTNIGIISTSKSALGLVSSGTLSWVRLLLHRLTNDVMIFFKLLFRGCWKVCL
jgi:hypothetical protein